jgi:hypothetical protein
MDNFISGFADELSKVAEEPVKRMASFSTAPQEKSIAFNKIRAQARQGGVTPELRQAAKNIPEVKQMQRAGLKPGDLPTEKMYAGKKLRDKVRGFSFGEGTVTHRNGNLTAAGQKLEDKERGFSFGKATITRMGPKKRRPKGPGSMVASSLGKATTVPKPSMLAKK